MISFKRIFNKLKIFSIQAGRLETRVIFLFIWGSVFIPAPVLYTAICRLHFDGFIIFYFSCFQIGAAILCVIIWKLVNVSHFQLCYFSLVFCFWMFLEWFNDTKYNYNRSTFEEKWEYMYILKCNCLFQFTFSLKYGICEFLKIFF